MNGPLPAQEVRAFLERCRIERRAAGLPEHLDDDDVIDRIAGLVTDAARRGGSDAAAGPPS